MSKLGSCPKGALQNSTPFWAVVLSQAPFSLWAYNGHMDIVNFPEHQHNQVGASGKCPHCGDTSYFHPVATFIDLSRNPIHQVASAAKCQGCKKFVLVIGQRDANRGQNSAFGLVSVYPLGKPKDDVDPNVPPGIAADFAEALRCQWVKAYRGCVVMCRRSVQTSALKLGAPKGRKLDKQIDWLFEQGKITEALKDFAHEVRLTGNVGAHPDRKSGQQEDSENDALEDVTPQDAADVVAFTEEFLHHVYVMPAKLKARKNQPGITTAIP